MNKVVISGLGVISPVGCVVKEFWTALVEARSGIGPLTLAPTERLTTRIAAQCLDFDWSQHFDEKRLTQLDRFAQFAVVAARQAVRDAGLELTEELALNAATIIGNGAGGQYTVDESYLKFYGQNSPRVHPLTIPRWMGNAAVSQVSMDLGLKGPAYTITSACASGTHAIGHAFQLVRTGQVPVALTGGAESYLTVGSIKCWEALRVLSTDTCRPFSKTRSGMVLGEGAAILVLETREHALARGARVQAPVLQVNHFFDTGGGDLRARDAIVRLRDEDGRWILAAKGSAEQVGGGEILAVGRQENLSGGRRVAEANPDQIHQVVDPDQ